MKKRIGFLSFGHWQPSPGSQAHTARDALVQSVELAVAVAVAAEEIGVDGAYVRVHHFAPQLASPFPLLAAMAARTSRIEMGTAVIDMRYENPLYMAEEAAAIDLISDGRLQLGISRGSPETALHGYEAFGYVPAEGRSDADEARAHTEFFRAAWAEAGWEREPRVSVSRSILPIVNDTDRTYFGAMAASNCEDQVGYLDGGLARFGESYVGEPEEIVKELVQDAAVRNADTILLTASERT